MEKTVKQHDFQLEEGVKVKYLHHLRLQDSVLLSDLLTRGVFSQIRVRVSPTQAKP